MILSFLATILFILASFGLGRFLVKLMKAPLHLDYIFLMGAGTFALFFFFTGQLYFGIGLTLPLLLAFAAYSLWHLKLGTLVSVRKNMAPLGLWVVLGLFALYFFFPTFIPPAGDFGDDAIAYHLLGPKLWIERAHLGVIADHSLTSFPALIEVMLAVVMMLSNDVAPQLLTWFFCCVLLFQMMDMAYDLTKDKKVVLLMGLVALSTTTLWRGVGKAFIDIPFATFVLATVRHYFHDKQRHRLAQALLCGLALSIKYTALFVPFSLLWVDVLALYKKRKSKSFSSELGQSLKFFVVAGLIGLPYYLRNLIALGVPVYPPPPVLYKFFNPKLYPYESSLWLTEVMKVRGHGAGKEFWKLLLLPFNLTYRSAIFHGSGSIGVVHLSLMPLTLKHLFTKEHRSFALFLAIMIGLWFISAQELRYGIGWFCLIPIISSLAIKDLFKRKDKGLRLLFFACLGISLAYSGVTLLKWRKSEYHSLVSKDFAQKYRKSKITHYDAYEYLNTRDEVKKVLILNSRVALYFLNKDFIRLRGPQQNTPLEPIATPDQATAMASKWGITHIFDVKDEFEDFLVPRSTYSVVDEGEDYRIFRLSR
jgi:hypothetical protein